MPARLLPRLGVALAATALLATGCTQNTAPHAARADGDPARSPVFTITDDGCSLSTDSLPGGAVTIKIVNQGSVPNEFEILAEDKLRIVAEKENIGPGTTTNLTTALTEGTYHTACKPNMVGALQGVAPLKVTPGSAPSVNADTAALEKKAVDSYTAYVKDQAGQLVAATEAFATAYTAGDTATAKARYASARAHYERIEPTAESFGLKEPGDLDAALDARIQDLSADAGASVSDPAVLSTWTGWHRIEADLWSGPRSPFAFKDQAARKAAADDLVANTRTLYDLVHGKAKGASGAFELTLADVVKGASGLLEEVATSKIVGEEETFSHTDLADFKANVEGARVAYGTVQELVRRADADLDAEIEQAFEDLDARLARHRDGKDSEGNPRWVDYSRIASVQKDAGEAPRASSYTEEQRKLSDEVNVLSEKLSKVAGTILH